LEKAKEKDELHIIGPMVIRSMSNAIYDTHNIGHYGLAFEHYTHFTSPIRRYADLLVHRVLFSKLQNSQYQGSSELSSQCFHISATEKIAAKAERASTKYMQVKYMADKLGNSYSGVITGVTDWGIFVEMTDTKCEGLVHISALDGTYSYNNQNKQLESIDSGASYHLGQKIEVSVKAVNQLKKQIDLTLAP
jgi:VacB/RNase II family 3'-5' exoribonuclease